MRRFTGLFKDVRGATAIEYGLIVSFIFLAIIVALSALGAESLSNFNDVKNAWPS